MRADHRGDEAGLCHARFFALLEPGQLALPDVDTARDLIEALTARSNAQQLARQVLRCLGELTPEGDYYFAITLPSLIVATYGGGTGLATQRECLEMLGCYGKGKVRKLAEIIAATVLCGELSLGSAITAEHWVSSHEELGRNR